MNGTVAQWWGGLPTAGLPLAPCEKNGEVDDLLRRLAGTESDFDKCVFHLFKLTPGKIKLL